MTKNPFLNALGATLYIVLIVLFINSLKVFADKPDTIIIPIAMLSLFVLSAATMSTLFFYRPIQIYLDGDKKGAFDLFLKTLVVFACITALIFLAFFLSAK